MQSPVDFVTDARLPIASCPGIRSRRSGWRIAAAIIALGWPAALRAQTGTAWVRHAPVLNGRVEGSLRQMTAENTTLNGGATITGDLLVPGTPDLRLNGHPHYEGTQDGAGAIIPTNHRVTLNGNASLRHLMRRTDAVSLPGVSAPGAPSGTRNVTLNGPGQPAGDFATLKNLTLNGHGEPVAVPPGNYGAFTANGGRGFILGTAGATTPGAYAFQKLTLNGNSTLEVAGPVEVTVKDQLVANADLGAAGHPDWLRLSIASGGLTLNGQRTVHALVAAPNGAVILNGGALLNGGLVADRLTINGGAVLRLIEAAPPLLTVVGGDHQLGLVNQFNPLPFDIGLWNAEGTAPIQNSPVTFAVTTGGGALAATNDGASPLLPSMTLLTDQDGTVQAFYRHGAMADVLSEIRVDSGGAAATVQSRSVANGDSDGDGLADLLEYELGTDPHSADTDGDGMSDGWEREHGFDPQSSADGAMDPDGDGRTNAQEYAAGTSPTDYFNGVLPLLTSRIPTNGALGPEDTLSLLVTNAAAQPLPNAPVTFTATSGGHLLANSPDGAVSVEVTVRTGSDGIAKVYVKKGVN